MIDDWTYFLPSFRSFFSPCESTRRLSETWVPHSIRSSFPKNHPLLGVARGFCRSPCLGCPQTSPFHLWSMLDPPNLSCLQQALASEGMRVSPKMVAPDPNHWGNPQIKSHNNNKKTPRSLIPGVLDSDPTKVLGSKKSHLIFGSCHLRWWGLEKTIM